MHASKMWSDIDSRKAIWIVTKLLDKSALSLHQLVEIEKQRINSEAIHRAEKITQEFKVARERTCGTHEAKKQPLTLNLWRSPPCAGGIWKRGFHYDQMFSVHTTSEEFKNATITGHFRFVFEENSVSEITGLSWCHRFQEEAPFSKCFTSTLKWKAGIFKFLRFKSVFGKLRLQDG